MSDCDRSKDVGTMENETVRAKGIKVTVFIIQNNVICR